MRFHVSWKSFKHLDIGMGIINVTVMCVVLLLTVNLSFVGSSDLYFPPPKGAWEKVTPEQAGWNVAKLKVATEYAGKQNSSGVIILSGGRILTEEYWKVESAKSHSYKYMLIETTSDGGPIEGVTSVQKSVISFLAAIAREQGKLDRNRTVTVIVTRAG